MTWRLAKSLETLRGQVNAKWPNRDKSSDGTIGDASHAAGTSDHNPDSHGVVRALDLTNDPVHGVNSRAIAEALVVSRDPRIKYVISNRQMARSYAKTGIPAWSWSSYTGSNPHTAHCHISVVADDRLADDPRPWALPGSVPARPPAAPAVFTNIEATMFADSVVAYSDVPPGWNDRPGVALPDRFEGPRPKVKVSMGGKSVVCEICDVGPWNTDNPYWLTAPYRPLAEVQHATGSPAQNGRIPTNKAGIDLTPAAAQAIGLPGKGLVNWEFAGAVVQTPAKPTTPSLWQRFKDWFAGR